MGITMKTQSEGKNRGTFAMLDNVAPNLFRHSGNQSYWGVKKMNGKETEGLKNSSQGLPGRQQYWFCLFKEALIKADR
jgi:hypothetical protein